MELFFYDSIYFLIIGRKSLRDTYVSIYLGKSLPFRRYKISGN
jgi:hypothetical protein